MNLELIRPLGFPLWYTLFVGAGGVLVTLPTMVFITSTNDNHAESFLAFFWAAMIGWMLAAYIRIGSKKQGPLSGRSVVLRMGFLTTFFILPIVGLALWAHTSYSYPLALQEFHQGDQITIYGIDVGTTRQEAAEILRVPALTSIAGNYYRQDGVSLVFKNDVVVRVMGDRLEANGRPLLGTGASLETTEQTLGQGMEEGSGGSGFRVYPLLELEVSCAGSMFPFHTEYTLAGNND